jgi:hypothetical protein
MAVVDIVAFAARIVVGATFLVAALAKLRNTPAFIAGVRAYSLLPETAVAPVGYLLLLAEFALGAALLVATWSGTREMGRGSWYISRILILPLVDVSNFSVLQSKVNHQILVSTSATGG